MSSLDELLLSISAMPQMAPELPSHPDLLLYAPCPIKLAVKDRIEAICRESTANGQALNNYIPMGCTSVDPYDPLYQEKDEARLPSVIASIGFGDFFRKEFVKTFLDSDLFQAVLPRKVHPMHEQAGTLDTRGHYVVYGVTPYVFLVDETRLGDLPLPASWADLLHPRYKGHINMCGDGDDMADAVLIGLFKDFGMEGIKLFADNTCRLMHSSTMVKTAGMAKTGSISILPYFFAESTKQPKYMKMIWPQEGAAASPLYFLAKRRERARVASLVDFFTQGFGQIESARWFLPLGGPMPESLPEGARIKWVGWDYIYNNDITAVRDVLNAEFRAMLGILR